MLQNTLFAFGLGACAVALVLPRLAALSHEPIAVKTPVALPKPAGMPPVVWTGIEIPADRLGQYQTEVRIDGFSVPVIVDTGATFVHLTAADARRIGLVLADADYRYQTATANGTTAVAMTTLHEVQLGGIRLYDVKATVSRGDGLFKSLLGMSFLGRLSKVEAANGHLTLRP